MTVEKRDLRGQTIIVTGATSGIGAASARLLASHGANVVLAGRRQDRLNALEAELGSCALAVTTDVRLPGDNARLVEAALDRFGRVDSLVLSAGVGFYGGIEALSDAQIDEMTDINLLGTIWGVRSAMSEFRRNGAGDIVIIASVAGLRGGAHEVVYAATKFGQVGLAGALDRELRADGIRVTAICPAGTSTEFALGTGRTAGDPALDQLLTADDVAYQVLTVLEQPRRMRTTQWSTWSMVEGG